MDENFDENNLTNTENTSFNDSNDDTNISTNNSNYNEEIDSLFDKTNNATMSFNEFKEKLKSLLNHPKSKLFIALFVLILFLFIAFSLINAKGNTIISGIYIKNIDVSNLTKEQAIEKINNTLSSKLSSPITLVYNDQKIDMFPEQLDISFDINSSVELAYTIGRNSNIFKNKFDILSSLFFKRNISPSFTYNEDVLISYLSEFENNLSDRLIEASYYIDGTNLIITSGKDGFLVDRERLKVQLLSYIGNLDSNTEIELSLIYKDADEINIDTIYSEIYKEAKDAYYTQEPFCVYPHTNGVDFAISIDEAKSMLKVNQDSYTVPLKITVPSITTNDIGTEAFPDLLATYTTTYSTKNVNRSTNIKLACDKIDGTVLMPGEVFSYNTIVGKRTADAGFKSAAVYVGGEVTTGIGGGICQVSSTLYNSVLLSNLEVVERVNHGFNPGYVPAGRDATVSWGGPDFKFKNNRTYPIKIICTTTGGKIITEIHGLKEENEYDVEISSYITKYIQYKTINQEDNTLPVGTTNVIQEGSNGCNAVCYKILKQNGEIISKTLISSDTYSPHNKIVTVGTKVE